jgi:hypothetical protein
MRLVAALAGAGAVLAAAGALRTVLVVVAFHFRELAPALMAEGALRAIPIVATFSTDRTLGVPVLAADEPITAVELDSIGRGDFEQTAEVARTLAAFIDRNAFVDAADLADGAEVLDAGAFRAEVAGRAIAVIAAWLAFAFDAVLVAALFIGAATARARGVAVVAVRAVLIARRAAMPVYAGLSAAVLVGAAFADHRVVAVIALRAVLGEWGARSAEAVMAWFGAIGIDLAAILDVRARVAHALEAAIAAVFGVGAAAPGHRGVAGIGCFAVLGVGSAGAAHARFAHGTVFISGAAVIEIDALAALALLTGSAIVIGATGAVGNAGFCRRAEVLPRGATATGTVPGRWVDVAAGQTSATLVACARVVLADLSWGSALLRADAFRPDCCQAGQRSSPAKQATKDLAAVESRPE